MKKIMALLLAAVMMTAACAAMASGNATIAVQGRDGFDEYISSMFVWDGRLLMCSWSSMYTWSPETRELVEVEGYADLESELQAQEEIGEDGERILHIGDTSIELEEDEYYYMDSQILALDDTLYRRMNISGENGYRTLLVELVIAEDGAMSLGEVADLGDALMVEYGDGYYGMRDLQNPCAYGGKLYALSYGDNGRELLAVDLEEASVEVLTLDTEMEISTMSPYEEGKLLMVAIDYSTNPIETSLLSYDIESEEITELGELPREGYDSPCAIVYDTERGKLYYTMAGSVWRMDVSDAGLGEPEEFGDMPLDAYSDTNAVLLDGMYILSSYEGVVGRDVELDKLPEQKLKVANNSYISSLKEAYFAFTDAHPEYMVSISDGMSTENIMQDMMNRASDVDIYTMDMSDEAFTALLERGFMAELSGSETLQNAVGSMYPVVRDAVTKDGELYAVPMNVYADCMTLNKELLTEKFGYTEEEMPETWPELFALVNDLSGKVQDVPEASLLGPGYMKDDARRSLFYLMLNDYFLWLDNAEDSAAGSDMLKACCEAFEAIDWDGFGMPEEYEDDTVWEYNEENIVLQSNSLSMRSYFGKSWEPEPMAIAEGEKAMIGMQISVAFVNPFSEHREAAIEYLEYAWSLLDQSARMCLDPSLNEPVESKYYEEGLKSYDEMIADLEKQLETAEDEEVRDSLTENLEDIRKWREEYAEEGRWDISPESIERYRAMDSLFAIQRSSIWSSEDTYTQVKQYLDGAMTAQQLVTALEKTLQMKRLEGM